MGACIAICIRSAVGVRSMSLELRERHRVWRGKSLIDGSPDAASWAVYLNEPSCGLSNDSFYKPHSLFSLVMEGKQEQIQRCLQKMPSLRNERNLAGETAVHVACRYGRVAALEELIDCGCPVDVTTDVGSPLHSLVSGVSKRYYAKCPQDELLVLRMLVDNGVNLEAVDRGKKTALFAAAEKELPDVMSALIGLGSDCNASESNQFTPLYVSAMLASRPCIVVLLAAGRLDLDRPDAMGRTPMMACLIMLLNEAKSYLLALGLKPRPGPGPDPKAKECPRHLPAAADLWRRIYHKIGIVERLLLAGGDPNVCDNYERTCLFVAFQIAQFFGPDSQHHAAFLSLLHILLFHGARFHPNYKKPEDTILPWLRQLHSLAVQPEPVPVPLPRSLFCLCRSHLRSRLFAVGNLHRICDLPLPSATMRFLSYEVM